MKERILVIEDEPGITLALKDELEFEGFEVEIADNGLAGLEAIQQRRPDLVILDLMLPGKNGFEVCREIRGAGANLPIIMLTARTQPADKVRGLDLGADDYVTKPFQLAELIARVRAVLRRSRPSTGEGSGAETYQLGPLRIDVKKHEVSKGPVRIDLTATEFELLHFMLKRPGQVITRDEFLDSVWGHEIYVTQRNVDSHVATLRKKIEDDPNHPQFILSVRGVGYKLNENPIVS